MLKWNAYRRSTRCAIAVGSFVLAAFAGPALAQESRDATRPRIAPVAPVSRYEAAVDATVPNLAGPTGEVRSLNTFSQIVSADVSTNGETVLDYAALVLDRDSADNLFIKVQGQNNSGKFNAIGFYHANGVGGWAGMTGGSAFIVLAAADQFTSAHMTVIHDGLGNVTLQLTNVIGGTDNQVYTRGGWTPRYARGVGFGALSGNYSIDNWGRDSVCDAFGRPDGALGADWVTVDGTTSIVGNTAHGSSNARAIYVGTCGGGLAIAEADVGLIGVGVEYAALVLNSDGVDNLFIKVQRQSAGSVFDSVGFYHGNNNGGWPGMTGGATFFSLPASQQFSTAHMKVVLEADGSVHLIFTDMDTVAGPLEFARGGWVVRNGHAAGFGGYAAEALMDNFSVQGLGPIDSFNRANGGLGSDWHTPLGTATIYQGCACGNSTSISYFTGTVRNASACVADIAPPGGNGVVNVDDLLKVIGSWGGCP